MMKNTLLPCSTLLLCEVVLAVLGSAGPALSAPAAQGVTEPTLSNGLQVVLVEDHWHPLAALEVCYRAGSRYDPAGKQGLAHLLEHLSRSERAIESCPSYLMILRKERPMRKQYR